MKEKTETQVIPDRTLIEKLEWGKCKYYRIILKLWQKNKISGLFGIGAVVITTHSETEVIFDYFKTVNERGKNIKTRIDKNTILFFLDDNEINTMNSFENTFLEIKKTRSKNKKLKL